jgi:hypothetical protein
VYAAAVLLATRVLASTSSAAVAASTLAAVGVFHALRRSVQRVVDRRFNRARYDADQAAAASTARLQDAADHDAVHANALPRPVLDGILASRTGPTSMIGCCHDRLPIRSRNRTSKRRKPRSGTARANVRPRRHNKKTIRKRSPMQFCRCDTGSSVDNPWGERGDSNPRHPGPQIGLVSILLVMMKRKRPGKSRFLGE